MLVYVPNTHTHTLHAQAPYNIERILHLLASDAGNDGSSSSASDSSAKAAEPVVTGAGIRRLMDEFYRGGPMVIPPPIMGARAF